ncbi:protein kinase (plasmid) [Gemmatirosa kalamazoonensis]|uniref:non-specific serine/threonine protein kinase n=1 Tax=Gemmatirosa kalamazoonensis TaxID=861299 RepID=W0RT14_9BACT|nr:protein kinase [Gemmatirosa kalamazoonensis]AHG92698.1 protein kinase [Gemmatirosa kalamazoonensis]
MTAPAMTPERWRAVDAVLQGALACEPERRDTFVREACGDDDALRREVAALLAAHHESTDAFLGRPAVEALVGPTPPTRAPERARIAAALAGRYEIEREIARGGMATVYLARDVRHRRPVAIKVLRDEVASAVGAERFLEEIRVTASLQHPHVLPLFDSGSADDLLWYAMPFVEGETLRTRLAREGRLTIGEAVRIAREVADALAHAHARGVVHRDVKPENVLLQDGHALVADFGIALALEHAGGERLTLTGLTLGTPQYMAPEQAAAERALDARVDVYALGAVLHEMLVGEPPFASGASRQVVLQRMLHEPPAPLVTRRPEVPPSLDAAVRRALEKRPDARFATAAELGAALVAPPAVPPSAATSSGRLVAARVMVYATLVALGIGLASGLLFGRSSLLDRWASDAPAMARPASTPASTPPLAPDVDVRATTSSGLSLVVVDRAGRPVRAIPAERPWTPRFSPDGRRVAYGAFGSGRTTSDVWVTDLARGTTQRITDDDADSNDPQWSPDGAVVAYSVSAPGGKDVAARRLDGTPARPLATRDGTQFPSDWLRDGSALLVTDDAFGRHNILVQPVDGSAPHPYAATAADETGARVSPDGRWIAYTSDESGQQEVYLDSYPRSGRRVRVSQGGGIDPVWRGDGRELYYWRGDALVAVRVGPPMLGGPATVGDERVLFHAPYQAALNTMYDVSPDGGQFVIVRR